MSTPTPRAVAACVKWVDLRPQLDPLHGTVTPSERGGGFSAADRSALEVALRLAEAWDSEVVLVCAAPPQADGALAELAASGAGRVVRVEQSPGLPSRLVAEVLAPVLGPGDLDVSAVVCGDLSVDRGSGSVPGFLAHHLQFAQALGLIGVEPTEAGRAFAVRRLDGARRERLALSGPTVLSVEGAVATLRRAPLAAALGGSARAVGGTEVRTGRIESHVEPPRMRPWRPRARVLPAPVGSDALERILSLIGAQEDHAARRALTASPPEAAAAILAQLEDWGYLEPCPENRS